jgi:hypothetical protein
VGRVPDRVGALVRAAFRMSWPKTLLGAWLVLDRALA